MALAPGAQLGPYRISSLLGTGGMGEGYRAHDPKLKRDVAIKVLPQHTAADPDRRARFEREAQSIAALNHPNIVTIYSVEEAGDVLFLTMELVDGQPVDSLIIKGGLPLTRLHDSGHMPRPVRDRCSARGGRHGRSLQGHRYPPGSHRCDHGAPAFLF